MNADGARDFLVWLAFQSGPRRPPAHQAILDELQVSATAVYRTWERGFGAELTATQVVAARAHPAADLITPDEPGRPAPYQPNDVPERVSGSYIVMMEPGTDPAGTAERAGVTLRGLFRFSFTGFAGIMTAEQLEIVRRAPGVTVVLDDITVGP
ncbi:hypothetical protein AB0F73_18555 [Micromonospora purpureochromogenes]|uniref:hypothetical protein n=1 Tax=Micromonospora purpureochromogenes TaxID=47872 RepID=UPI0034016DE1